MNFTLVQLPVFAKRWAQFKLTDEDLQALERLLMDRPLAGSVMPGTGGLRKARFAPPSAHTGKSGAYRVGYVVLGEVIVLLVIFPKSAQPNLTGAEKVMFKKVIESLIF